jgi:hypothetical protein
MLAKQHALTGKDVITDDTLSAEAINGTSDAFGQEVVVEITKMLILDVKTRWSSTHQMMGKCAELTSNLI